MCQTGILESLRTKCAGFILFCLSTDYKKFLPVWHFNTIWFPANESESETRQPKWKFNCKDILHFVKSNGKRRKEDIENEKSGPVRMTCPK